ncbi:unnamed protein product [Albugo candida]|uniref:Secreted protein n=1 Tax=Albugo candida TaxID=65357 RepID=A0A024GME4_9STRA|nr:unnamed protein product [Albugo candida]|eukprot:CCI47712.1 unnamed protein product [Albugo candida]
MSGPIKKLAIIFLMILARNQSLSTLARLSSKRCGYGHQEWFHLLRICLNHLRPAIAHRGNFSTRSSALEQGVDHWTESVYKHESASDALLSLCNKNAIMSTITRKSKVFDSSLARRKKT